MGSLSQAISFLIETVVQLYLLAVLMRLLLEMSRADFYNPVVQLLLQITNPVIQPLQRILPRSRTINIAGIVALYLIEVFSLLGLMALAGQSVDLALVLLMGVMRLLRLLLTTYMVLIIISVILSWVGQSLRHPIIPLIYQLVDPVLMPIRQILPAMGGLDLSPLVAILAIQFLMILLGL